MIAGKLVTKTEIPAFIPRQDLMDQLVRWAVAEADEPRGLGMWGLPVKVEPYYKDEDVLWGITFTILRDGEVATQLGVWYDDEEVRKHEWVGRGADGFPILEGKESDVVGKHLEIRCASCLLSKISIISLGEQLHAKLVCIMSLPPLATAVTPRGAAGSWHAVHAVSCFCAPHCRKLDENPVDDVLRETIRNICQQLVAAINKYYAFGSAFVDDAT